MTMNGIRRWLAGAARDEQGSTAAALAFAVLAGVLMTSMIGATISVITISSAVDKSASIDSAMETRYSQWATEVDAGATPALDDICYRAFSSCVRISDVTAIEAGTAVTLEARYGQDAGVRERVKVHVVEIPSHIVGYDSAGRPVWAAVN
jgi:hypothetical protein